MKIRLLLLLSILPIVLIAQTAQVADSASLVKAAGLYEVKDYVGAALILRPMAEREDDFPNKSAVMVMLGKCYSNQEMYTQAKIIFNRFLQEYPASGYRQQGILELSEVLVREKKYDSAASVLTGRLKETIAKPEVSEVKEALTRLYLAHYSPSEIGALLLSGDQPDLVPFYYLVWGKSLLTTGDREGARDKFSKIINQYPLTEEHQQAVKLYAIDDQTPLFTKVIAAVLPLTEEGEERPGNDILLGVKFAVDRYNASSTEKIALIIRDTYRNEDSVKAIAQELTNMHNLYAVIGPVYSSEVNWFCQSFTRAEVPVLTPTATDDALSVKYGNLIQTNTPMELRAVNMAQYIYFVEGKYSLAVVYSEYGNGKSQADDFITEFTKLGGKVVTTLVYPSTNDGITQELQPLASRKSEIDGIYAPVSERKMIPHLLSGLVNNGLIMPVFGNQEFFQARGIDAAPELEGMVHFTSDHFIDVQDNLYLDLNRDFFGQNGTMFLRNNIFGYESANLITSAVTGTGTTLFQALTDGTEKKGIMKHFFIDSRRTNRFMNILRYRDGVYERIDVFRAN